MTTASATPKANSAPTTGSAAVGSACVTQLGRVGTAAAA